MAVFGRVASIQRTRSNSYSQVLLKAMRREMALIRRIFAGTTLESRVVQVLISPAAKAWVEVGLVLADHALSIATRFSSPAAVLSAIIGFTNLPHARRAISAHRCWFALEQK
jgi:hypothetical protein